MRLLLTAPAPPLGRARELEQLRVAMKAVAAGERRVVLVAGAAGVGKSSLIQQLRPLAEECGGRFIVGKFDQHNERETTALLHALSSLGRQLLTGSSDDDRMQLRSKILRALGAQAGLARVVPEFALLLADVPDARAADPAHAAARMAEVMAGLLRATASPDRPVVLVLDDLQWSGALSTRLIDTVLAAADLGGLLLVGAYRHDELPPSHPLISAMARWAEAGNEPQLLPISNLGSHQVAQLLGRMLSLSESSALRLARLLVPHAHGNPYETMELVNGLRDEGLFAVNAHGLCWDDGAVRRYLDRTRMEDVLAVRIARLPDTARELLQVLACMGAQTSREVARMACAFGPGQFEAALAVLRDRGFVLREPAGDGVLRLRHDRVQQAAYAALPPSRRGSFHLTLARRLIGHEGLAFAAADQYACTTGEELGPTECTQAAALLRDTAAQSRLIANHTAAHRMQEAALRLLESAVAAGAAEPAALAACEIDYHIALYTVGRLEEADAIYQRIEARGLDTLRLIDAACAQVTSLANRGRIREAIELGLRVLSDLGLNPPSRFSTSDDVSDRFQSMRRWVDTFDLARECARADVALPPVVAAAKMIYRLMSPALFTNADLLAWLVIRSQALWEKHGPCASLVVGVSWTGVAMTALRQDRRTGYLAARQALDLCEARGWEPDTSQVRCAYALTDIHWFEPIERAISEAERAREGVLATGDLRTASFSYRLSALHLFECDPSLHRCAEEAEGALALSRRAGNQQAIARCLADRQALDVLRAAHSFESIFESSDASDDSDFSDDPGRVWLFWYHESWRVVISAIFADGARLSRHARLAMGLRRHFPPSGSFYQIVWLYWLAGLAAAWELQQNAGTSVGPEPQHLAELDGSIEWLRQRAIDAPLNFRHMHLHLQAERAWALGDRDAAARRFDDALGAADRTRRPWHEALITERAARLHLAVGWEWSGQRLLLEAQQLYASWGAAAKAALLGTQTGASVQAESHALQLQPERTPLAANQLDRLAVQRAAQALASERSPKRLEAKVGEVLASITGATHVALALRDEDAASWVAATGQPLPQAALRYAERTREPLLLADAVADDRFSRDPYFEGMSCCALMVIPILHQGDIRAILLLENRAGRGAFSAQRRDAVLMIAGQLAVSLENARLYEGLERKVHEQTRQLREAQSLLVDEARRAGMAQIATNVLHNVGNVLTSVNVSAHFLTEHVRNSRVARVADLAEMLDDHATDLAHFFTIDEKGLMLPGYLHDLAAALDGEHDELLTEIQRLGECIEQINTVVARQQLNAKSTD